MMYPFQDQDTRRAGARGLTRTKHRGLARRLRRAAVGAVCAAAVAVPVAGAATAQAATAAPHTLTSTWTNLTLLNGWTDFGSGTAAPAVTNISGIVHLKGAMRAGTSAEAFILPVGDRPATAVNVPVDLSGATAGELDIQPSGMVDVSYEQTWSDAQAETSLDGVSFATSGSSFTKLTLLDGWANYGPPYASAAVRSTSGIVHLEGAIKNGGPNPVAFYLPAGFRPTHTVYVPVTQCSANNGRLDIYPDGEVYVETEGGTWSNAQCLTSLDGAWFAKSTSLYTPLTLQNGWVNDGSGTTTAAVRKVSGIVSFEGAIVGGTNPQVFTLPAGFRPSHEVILSVDLYAANRGHLVIQPSGVVSLYPEGNVWSNASTFTSLDGVSFAP